MSENVSPLQYIPHHGGSLTSCCDVEAEKSVPNRGTSLFIIVPINKGVLYFQDTSFQQWPLEMSFPGPGSLCLLQGLSGYFETASAIEGDSLRISNQADGSVLLQMSSDSSRWGSIRCASVETRSLNLHKLLVSCFLCRPVRDGTARKMSPYMHTL